MLKFNMPPKKDLEEMIKKAAIAKVHEALSKLECKEHGTKVIIEDGKPTVIPCCQAFVDEVARVGRS